MIRRILLTGIVAGLLAGTVGFVVQALSVTPLIHEAEKYEAEKYEAEKYEAEKYEASAARDKHLSAPAAAETKDAGSDRIKRWTCKCRRKDTKNPPGPTKAWRISNIRFMIEPRWLLTAVASAANGEK